MPDQIPESDDPNRKERDDPDCNWHRAKVVATIADATARIVELFLHR